MQLPGFNQVAGSLNMMSRRISLPQSQNLHCFKPSSSTVRVFDSGRAGDRSHFLRGAIEVVDIA